MTTAGSSAQGHDLVLRAGAATDVGRVRDHNEDSLLVTASVFAVADGMGGHAAGEVASRIVTETLEELAERDRIVPDDIVAALALANTRLLESAARHPEQTGMGTTATGLSVVSAGGSDHWAVFNVGDSRVYRLVDAELNLVTVDHSEVQEMIDAGLLTAEQAARHPLRNIVTRSLGTEVTPVPDLWVFPPSPGERFVICSDGLSNELSREEIRRVVVEVDDPQQAAVALVAAAVEAGGRDNVTAIVVALDAGQEEPDIGADTAPRGATRTSA